MTNLAIFTGRITKDLELKDAGKSKVVRFSLAVDNPFKKDDTSFFNIEAWNNTAERLTEYCGKGSKILVECSAKQDNFTDKEGNKREVIKFNANRIEYLDNKQSNNQSNKQSNPNPFANGSDDLQGELPF